MFKRRLQVLLGDCLPIPEMTKLLFQLGRRSLLRSRALVGALPSLVLGLTCRSPFQAHFGEAYHVEGCASCRTRLSPQTLDFRHCIGRLAIDGGISRISSQS